GLERRRIAVAPVLLDVDDEPAGRALHLPGRLHADAGVHGFLREQLVDLERELARAVQVHRRRDAPAAALVADHRRIGAALLGLAVIAHFDGDAAVERLLRLLLDDVGRAAPRHRQEGQGQYAHTV